MCKLTVKGNGQGYIFVMGGMCPEGKLERELVGLAAVEQASMWLVDGYMCISPIMGKGHG